MTWDIDVHTAGEYEVVLDYTCPMADAGSTIEVSLGAAGSAARSRPAGIRRSTPTRTRFAAPGESRMKEFRPLRLGVMRLQAGRGPLVLRALEIPGRSVMDVRRVTLTLQ